uniref:Secreted protein n=1 Tax=Globodera rostochiensis TaxID=31243 RepID=A0A914HLJ0_GLORO
MKTVVALVAFLAIFVPLNSAFGGPLKCHRGSAFSFDGTDSSAISNCSSPRDQYCIEATCTALDQLGNTIIIWGCEPSQQPCDLYEQTIADHIKSKNVSCACSYGEKGINLTNVPSSAAKKRLRCKAGTLDASEVGKTNNKDCIDGYEYCYAAYCAKAKCYAANHLIGERSMFKRCGDVPRTPSAVMHSVLLAKGVPYGNKDFPFSTTTTQKPTTLTTTKKTTTTKKPTTKTTTTKEKPTTKTTMTTLKDPMPVSGQPMMATTADVNRSARRSVAIFWTFLIAIGILA